MLQIVSRLAVRVSRPAFTCIRRTSVCKAGSVDLQYKQAASALIRRRFSSSTHTVKPTLIHAATAAPAAPAVNMPESAVQGLQPQALWDYFYALTQIPRPSKFEDK